MVISAWVVGGSGLLGSALERRLRNRPRTGLFSCPINWTSEVESIRALRSAAESWLSDEGADAFELYWAAGAGVTSSRPDALEQELKVFSEFLAFLGDTTALKDRGLSLFLSSSAGGVYAGSEGAPFTELSEPRPITPYGETKLAMETVVREFSTTSGARSFIGRLSNLYGPDQRIDKAQGFITHLCRSLMTRTPLSVYVPLDTMRDYIYADDAATVIVAGMRMLTDEGHDSEVVLKNVCSGVPATIGHLLHEAKLVFKRSPALIVAPSAFAVGQVLDLRIASIVWPELDRIPRRPLLIGLVQTRASMELQRLSRGLPST